MSVEIIDVEQGSPEWHQCRLGIPTASMFSSILAKGEGKMRRSYLSKLFDERFTGEVADGYVSEHMKRGKEMEDEARRAYAFLKDADPIRVGFVRNGNKGCSPDSLIGDVGMIEIKTKLPHLQMEALQAKQMPPEHKAQVQGALWVSEREWCDFVSYYRRMPELIVRVYRDEAYIRNLAGEVARFNDDLDALTQDMIRRGATLHPHFAIDLDPQAVARGSLAAIAAPVDVMTTAIPAF